MGSEKLGTCDNSPNLHVKYGGDHVGVCVNWREHMEPPDPYRTHLDTKEADQRRQLQARLQNRTAHIDPADIGAPHLKEEREQPQGEATQCPTCGSWAKKQIFCELAHHGGWERLTQPHTPQPNVRCRACTDPWHGVPAQTEGGEKPLTVTCGNQLHPGEVHYQTELCLRPKPVEPSSPPATAGTAREFRKMLPCEYWTNEYVEAYTGQRVRQVRNKFCEVHQPDDLDSCPACEAVHQADLVAQLQTNLAKLYAAIGPMDELDTVDDAVARVAQLRQERDALKRELEGTPDNAVWGKQKWIELARYWNDKCKEAWAQRDNAITHCESEREARERAEKALREALAKDKILLELIAKCEAALGGLPIPLESLAALNGVKSSEGAK